MKNPSKPQNLLPNSTENGTFAGSNANDDPQPYEEVLPGDSDYAAAVGAADARMQQYHTRGFRYGFCPPTYTDDIVDPVIVAQANANVTVTSDVGLGTPSAADPKLLVMSPLAPVRPHYVAQDDTDPPGDWLPRRPDWATALVNPDIASFVKAEDRGGKSDARPGRGSDERPHGVAERQAHARHPDRSHAKICVRAVGHDRRPAVTSPAS